MKKIVILLSIIAFSCQGQKYSEDFYTPIELSYSHNSSYFTINEKTILNYVMINPLVARQVYDKNIKEFQEINSKVKFTRKECSDLIVNYVNIKTDPEYYGIFYNPTSNEKINNSKISENSYFPTSKKDSKYYKCICLKNNLIKLPIDYKEIQSEFNLPGGYALENKEIKNSFILNLIDSLKKESFLDISIFKLSDKIKVIKKTKSIIYSDTKSPTKMYILKNDPVEVIVEKDNWLKIKYYPEKNGDWTGKTIEGWIKKSDVE